MSFKGKPVRVKLVGDADIEYQELNKAVGQEITTGVKKSFNQVLLRAIKQKVENLKLNPQYGTNIEKKKIPKKYIDDYDVNNLWKIDLPSGWRMVYTIKGSEVEILAVVLDITDHIEYDKKFGYRGR